MRPIPALHASDESARRADRNACPTGPLFLFAFATVAPFFARSPGVPPGISRRFFECSWTAFYLAGDPLARHAS
jgi:hypothetical protein